MMRAGCVHVPMDEGRATDHGVVMWAGDEGENWEVAWCGGYGWMASAWPLKGRRVIILWSSVASCSLTV